MKSWPARVIGAQARNLGSGRSSAFRAPYHQPASAGMLSVKGTLLFLLVQKVLPVLINPVVSVLCSPTARCNLHSTILCIPSASI